MTLPRVKISPLKCLCMMTSSDRADLKKIVEISITNIFIFPLIICDDIIQFVLLADLYPWLPLADHSPGRSGLVQLWTTTDHWDSTVHCTCLSPGLQLDSATNSHHLITSFPTNQHPLAVTQQTGKLSN